MKNIKVLIHNIAITQLAEKSIAIRIHTMMIPLLFYR